MTVSHRRVRQFAREVRRGFRAHGICDDWEWASYIECWYWHRSYWNIFWMKHENQRLKQKLAACRWTHCKLKWTNTCEHVKVDCQKRS